MAVPDYYNILGVSKSASDSEIKKAYHKLARKHHPDLHQGDKDANRRFQQINEAYEVLKDPEKRKQYDAYGENWKHAEQFEKAKNTGRGESFYSGEGFHDDRFSDFFESLFGRQHYEDIRYRGADQHATLELSLEQITEDNKQVFTINGKNIRITIPAGVEDGSKIKLKGYGLPGHNGGPNGDLYISFKITEHPSFERKGANLYKTEYIGLYTSILGGEVIVEGLKEKLKVKVAPETQQNTVVRLKGKGLPFYKGEGRGDLYITFSIQIPTQLTEQEINLFKQLQALQKK